MAGGGLIDDVKLIPFVNPCFIPCLHHLVGVLVLISDRHDLHKSSIYHLFLLLLLSTQSLYSSAYLHTTQTYIPKTPTTRW